MLAALQFEGVGNVWLWLLLLVAGMALMVWTYATIYQRTRRGFTWWLLALRAAGVLALVLALAKPTWTEESEFVDHGRVAVVLDNSISMSLNSRYALATKAIEELRAELGFKKSKVSGPAMELDVFDIHGRKIDGKIPAEPRAERTDLFQGVSRAMAQLRSKPLTAVVLISDGIDNTGRDDTAQLADSTIPIYGVGFPPNPEATRLDLAIRDVQTLDRVMVDNDAQVTVMLSKSAGPAVEATVTIRRGGDQPIATETVKLDEGSGEQRVELTFTPQEAGTFVYTANVTTATGERLLANNARHFPLQVDADAIGVLYLEGFLRYEYKFLKSRLEDDPDVHLVAEVRRTNPQRPAIGASRLNITTDLLKNIDVVILGDMDASYLTDAEYQTLARWVDKGLDASAQRAHSLLVLGGYESFGAQGFAATPLAELLPVVFADSVQQSDEPFVLELTEAGKQHPIFHITGDRVQDETMWSAAPPLLGLNLIERAKAGAQILAVNPRIQRENQSMPVVVTGRYGSGHVMVIAADTTWRWSRFTRLSGKNDTHYARFWSQTIRWLAGRDVQNKRSLLTVSTDRPSYEVGQPVAIRVVHEPEAGTEKTADVRVEIADESGQRIPVSVRSSSSEPNIFSGSFYPSAGGRFQLHAILRGEGKVLANQTSEFLVHGSDLELSDTEPNSSLLKTIASRSGGVYVDVDRVDQLAEHIERKERRIPRVQRREFWNSPILFLFFLGAVSSEWVLRKRNHLI